MKLKIQRKYLILMAFAGFVLCLDQLTKLYIHTHYLLGESLPVLRDIFHITYVRNTGAAFGILRNAHEGFRDPFFLTMPVIAMIMIIFILRGLAQTERAQIVSLSCIFGGALGNYIDRLRFGYVIDFLDFQIPYYWMGRWRYYSYPAFNVADIAIVGGVIVLLLIMFLQWREEISAKKSNSSSVAS